LRESEGWTTWHGTCPELRVVQDAIAIDDLGALSIARFCAENAEVLLKGGAAGALAEIASRELAAKEAVSKMCKVSL
jgi:hypothetical protein